MRVQSFKAVGEGCIRGMVLTNARAAHEARLTQYLEKDAANNRPEGLAETVDGAGDALHDALLDGDMREEGGEARHLPCMASASTCA